jgi:hypothetical protein
VIVMPRSRRYLALHEIRYSKVPGYLQAQEERFAACPAAAQYTDEEAEDFLGAALVLDNADPKGLVEFLQIGGIAFPPELAYDGYRLSRYVMHHKWANPVVRAALLDRVRIDWPGLERQNRQGNLRGWTKAAEHYGPPAVIALMRHRGLAAQIPEFMAALPPWQLERHRALLMASKLLLHRYLTEPEPPRQPTPWEQRRLARRLRLRELQMRSMRSSLYKLRRERKALLNHMREVGRQKQPELDAYLAELEELRQARCEAERRHAAAMAEQARHHQETIARLRQQLAAAQQDYSAALQVRGTWLPLPGR